MQNNFSQRSSFGRRRFSHNRSQSSGRGYSGSGNRSRSNFGSKRKRGELIDIGRFVKRSDGASSVTKVEIKNVFADFGFSPELNANLVRKNYLIPTPIQDQTIPHIILGKDLIGLANTGTGKTAAFLLPLINKVAKNRNQKVLIIAPTRELAQQINEEFRQFSSGLGLYSAVCVGGMPIHRQINEIKRQPSFVIGTPGRLKDLSERHLVKFETFENIVLDEVDRMLDMGFVNEIKKILNALPKQRQSLFFCATLPLKIKELIKQFLREPVTVSVVYGETAENVDQDIVRVRDSAAKFDQLRGVLKQDEVRKVLIFSETKAEVNRLATNLVDKGFKADCIHGNKRQSQRQKALLAFKNNYVDILVATDVAARGLDIQDITHVINYTVPQTYNDYIHRIGRTGRGESKGKALTFVDAN